MNQDYLFASSLNTHIPQHSLCVTLVVQSSEHKYAVVITILHPSSANPHRLHFGFRATFSYRSKKYATLLEKASFVSGRDAPSIDALSGVLRESKDPATQPDDVARVRDPVLSDKMFTDVEGKCWKQSEGEGRPEYLAISEYLNTYHMQTVSVG